MKTRLWKDIHHLLPIVLIGGTTGALAVHLPDGIAWWATMGSFYTAIIFAGVLAFGHEHAHGRMAILLSQPISRIRIWWEKILALAVVCGFMAFTAFTVGALSEMGRGWISPAPYCVGKADGYRGPIDVDNEAILTSAEMQYGRVAGRCIAWPAIWTAHFPTRSVHYQSHSAHRVGMPILFGDTQKARPREVHRVWIVFGRYGYRLLIGMATLGCVALWMGLIIRSPHTAFWAAAVIPLAYRLLVTINFLEIQRLLSASRWQFGINVEPFLLGAIALVASRIHIQRMEV